MSADDEITQKIQRHPVLASCRKGHEWDADHLPAADEAPFEPIPRWPVEDHRQLLEGTRIIEWPSTRDERRRRAGNPASRC